MSRFFTEKEAREILEGIFKRTFVISNTSIYRKEQNEVGFFALEPKEKIEEIKTLLENENLSAEEQIEKFKASFPKISAYSLWTYAINFGNTKFLEKIFSELKEIEGDKDIIFLFYFSHISKRELFPKSLWEFLVKAYLKEQFQRSNLSLDCFISLFSFNNYAHFKNEKVLFSEAINALVTPDFLKELKRNSSGNTLSQIGKLVCFSDSDLLNPVFLEYLDDVLGSKISLKNLLPKSPWIWHKHYDFDILIEEKNLEALRYFKNKGFSFSESILPYSVVISFIEEHPEFEKMFHEPKLQECSDDSVEENKYGAHPTHCCIRHGCKYGDDDCPVVNGIVKQVYLCEGCGYEGFKTLEDLLNHIEPDEVAKLLFEKIENWDGSINALISDNEYLDLKLRLKNYIETEQRI